MLGRIVDELVRREGPRILAGLIGRLGGNFDLAEDSLQDAYERARANGACAAHAVRTFHARNRASVPRTRGNDGATPRACQEKNFRRAHPLCRALALARNPAERLYLERRLREVTDPSAENSR